VAAVNLSKRERTLQDRTCSRSLAPPLALIVVKTQSVPASSWSHNTQHPSHTQYPQPHVRQGGKVPHRGPTGVANWPWHPDAANPELSSPLAGSKPARLACNDASPDSVLLLTGAIIPACRPTLMLVEKWLECRVLQKFPSWPFLATPSTKRTMQHPHHNCPPTSSLPSGKCVPEWRPL
jgi:hypothetical protein